VPHTFHITLKADGRDEVPIAGEFTDAEQAALQLFLRQYERLTSSKPLREGFPCKANVNWEEASPLVVETDLPDDDTLSILLHRLRPFILQKEAASFPAVSSVIGKSVGHPHIRQLLRDQNRLYDGRQFQSRIRIASNKDLVNSERVLVDWLNSHEYHGDPEKRDAIEDLFGRMPGHLMRFILVSMLVDKVEAIRNLAALVAVMLGKSNKLTFAAHESSTG
jgi:hypothetical protein